MFCYNNYQTNLLKRNFEFTNCSLKSRDIYVGRKQLLIRGTYANLN